MHLLKSWAFTAWMLAAASISLAPETPIVLIEVIVQGRTMAFVGTPQELSKHFSDELIHRTNNPTVISSQHASFLPQPKILP